MLCNQRTYKVALYLALILVSISSYSQQTTEGDRYKLRQYLSSQDTVYLKIGKSKTILKKGWVISKMIDGISIRRTLEKDTIIISKKYIPIKVTSNWKIGEVKHSDDEPNKLFLNPYHFKSPEDSLLNNISYIKIPENGYVTLKRSFFKWQAITIPFAIRPALNDSVGSKITTNLKIGASFSYNMNWETFKNRRIKANKSVKGVSFGIGAGLSRVVLNSSSTSLLETPYKSEEDGLAFFILPGIGLNLKGFQINVSYGWDIPITNNVFDWNYVNKGYFGIGLGVGLDIFGKQ